MGLISVVRLHLRWQIAFLKLIRGSELFGRNNLPPPVLPDNTQHSQQISTPPVWLEPTISAGERPQNYALDRAVNGTGAQKINESMFN